MIEFQRFEQRTNLLLVIDHAGRAGNGFFQTLFDSHPQVLACPWLHYVYSYMITEFGESDLLDTRTVHAKWCDTTYFALLYHDLDEQRSALIYKMGGDPSAQLDRALLRKTFDEVVLSRESISRRALVAAIFYSYATGLGRNPEDVRYLLCTDSISLRYESVMSGFSGQVVDVALHDYPLARLVHLERDPRAGLASSIHQFVNQLGNMYGVNPRNAVHRLCRLYHRDFNWDSVFVFGFWLLYFRQTYHAIMRKRAEHSARFLTVRNEDLNLDFVPTMRFLARELGVEWSAQWTNDFTPTMVGCPWQGTGAYNNRYQKNRYGPLQNDPDRVARQVTGPNAYVTQRWRSRMKPNEILVAERLMKSEIEQFGYEFCFWKEGRRARWRFWLAFWRPLRGELPAPRWIVNGSRIGVRELIDRLFYCFVFPVFYVYARIVFLQLVKETGIFSEKAADDIQ